MSLVWLLWAGAANALVEVEHPDPAAYDQHIQAALREAQDRFAQQDNPGPVAWGNLGMVYQAHELGRAAFICYQNAHELAPKDGRWTYFLGLLASEEGRFDDAIKWFSASQLSNAFYTPAKVRLTRARIEAGQIERAEAELRKYVQDYPEVAAFQADLARLLRQKGDNEAAVKLLHKALQLQPKASSLRYSLAMAYRDLGQMEQARLHLGQRGDKQVLIDDPLNVRMRSTSRSYSYFMTLGVQAADNGDFNDALRYLETALEIAPDNVFVLQTHARVLEAAGDLEAATAQVERALDLQPDFALALEYRGILHEIKGDDLIAELLYERALGHDPSLFEARALFANVLMRSRQFERAAKQYAELIKRHPGQAQAHLRLAAAQYESGQCLAAINSMRQLLGSTPGNPGHFMAYARIVASCKNVPEPDKQNALAGMNELYRLDPSLHVTTTLAMVESAAGNFAGASDLQAQALFMMVRDGRTSDIEAAQATLKAYQSQDRPTRAWSPTNPIIYPPRLRLEDRR